MTHPGPDDLAPIARQTGRLYPDGHYAVIWSAGLAPAPALAAEQLHVELGASAIRRERAHLDAAGAVVSVSTSWFPAELARDCPALLECKRIPIGTAAYIAVVREREVVRVFDAVSAMAATAAQATALGVEVGSPAQRVMTLWADTCGVPIEFGESFSGPGRDIVYSRP